MLDRALRRLAHLSVRRPVLVLVGVALVSALLLVNVGRLQLRTDLVDLVAGGTYAGKLQREAIRKLGYGNQFYVVVEGGPSEADAETIEAAADRLTEEMQASGYFEYVRSGMSEDELTEVVRLYAWNFPAFADPAARQRIAERLSPDGVRERVRSGVAGLVTPFGTMGISYFAADPLGLSEFLAPETRGSGGFMSFDMEWGSGGRFFSRDHHALLLIAHPRLPASDYEFSVGLVKWMRQRIAALLAEHASAGNRLRAVPVGAHVYAEQNRRLIQENMQVASAISVAGNLLLLLLVYRWLPAIVLTVVPTSLALLWTTGIVALYPGIVNLVSLAFIAILAGLGDDQVTYFFSRVPEERDRGAAIDQAVATTFLTTGKSVLFCVLTTSTGTLALAFSRFSPLAELGLILTVGLLMLAVHTLVTVPALMALWWRYFPGGVSGPPFRLLPSVADRIGSLVAHHPRAVVAALLAVLAAAAAALPGLRMTEGGAESFEGADTLGVTGQRLLSERFGLEGAPTVFLVEGSLPSVLARAERLESRLLELGRTGGIRSVASPSSFFPAEATQEARRRALTGVDLELAADTLAASLAENGLSPAPFAPTLERMRGWREGRLTLAEVRSRLPMGLLDNAITEIGPGRYLAAVTVYSANPVATAAIPRKTLLALEADAGPLVEFSYDRVGRDLHERLVTDSRLALAGTLVGVVAIVLVGFRRLKPSLLVLAPIAYGVVVTFGLLALAGHRFSAMAFSSIPLIIGIGIDNGIHLVRRYLERPDGNVRAVLAASGPAVIQTNLTTVIGFGALMSSSFGPLREMGLITALGVGCTLVASLTLVPALLAGVGAPQPPPRTPDILEAGRANQEVELS